MKTRRVAWNAVTAGVLLCAFLIGGCAGALVGTWKADPEPKDAAAYINSATFKNDNTYTAVEKKGDQVDKFAGTYEFNGFNLKLKSPGKPDRVYSATYVMGGKLELKSGDKKLMLKKQ
jgi:hypothetical protein